MATEVNRLANVITCHAFSPDKSFLALCPNNHEIHIFGRDGNSWNLETILKEHDQTVLGLDWAPKSNRIISCSQDRNAYVWNLENGAWKPALVILRINRAATSVKWSPLENKFAVGSGAKTVSVCYFEEEGNWWISKHIKKGVRSTVLSVDWHPNNLLLAVAGCDFKCRIYAAGIRGVDKSNKIDVLGGKLPPFGDSLVEFDQCLGWVHGVSWSPSGNQLAFSGHDSRVVVADIGADPQPTNVTSVRLPGLPLVCILFINENTIIGAGHECNPAVFTKAGGTWKFQAWLDKAEAAKAAGGDARSKFQTMDKTGQETNVTQLNTKHQNTIKSIVPYAGSGANITQVATSGVDGKLVIWNVK